MGTPAQESDNFVVQLGAAEGAEEVSLLEPVPPDRQLILSFQQINGHVPVLSIGNQRGLVEKLFKRKKLQDEEKAVKKPQARQIMHDLTGECRPGEVLALMGPSGSSKTSLLSVLGGRTPSSLTMTGEVLYNGEKLTKKSKRNIGYVLQDDVLYESLTVHETLYYAAMLRLPQDMSKAQKLDRVDKTITALGLKKCQNTIIGGFFHKGISGGERKRVSVGHELLMNPSCLLLDEPTSGLDSTTAMHLVVTLRQLALGGRAVVTTIHQPSSRLYQQLDKLLLLSEGHCMYYGEGQKAAEWFEKLGYKMPYGINTADFILDLASGDVATHKLKGEGTRQHLIQCAEKYLGANPGGFRRDGKELTEKTMGRELWAAAQSRLHLYDSQKGSFSDSPRASMDVEQGSMNAAPSGSGRAGGSLKAGPRWGAPYWLQFRILLQRSFKVRRFESLSKWDFGQYITVGLLAGLFWLQKGQNPTVADAQNLRGLLFFEMMFLSIRSMIGALLTFSSVFKMVVKERASGMYHLSAFFFARMASDLPVDSTLPTIFIAIIYFMAGLRYDAWSFFANWASVILVMLTAQSLGLLVGALVTNPKIGQTIVSVVALSMVLVAGFFVQGIHAWIAWLKYFSFIYYGYNLLQKIQFHDTPLYDCGAAGAVSSPQNHPDICTRLEDPSAALNLQRDANEWPWEPLVLIGWMVLYRLFVYLALRKRTKSKVR
ncbi:ABC transporter G family [Klebsormidium nitens]|uniref:ABC transporter G family n=1 Tax=Klebsormidium nitens TaxID=105231 RepID=A0A1Y1HL85_KLENI|nr:ABC transporter G family [Klebsormidium nitens]|eukprot:GAQ77731.1 ABC transporter G family [Klebsormidium nitens]